MYVHVHPAGLIDIGDRVPWADTFCLRMTLGMFCGVGLDPLPTRGSVDEDLIALMSDLPSSQLVMSRAAYRDRRAAEIAEALANTDALTGLVNRRNWDLLVADAQERLAAFGDLVAVWVFDLDGLKAVKYSSGHDAGDELLRRTTGALRPVAGPIDRVARFGGDEFAILTNDPAE